MRGSWFTPTATRPRAALESTEGRAEAMTVAELVVMLDRVPSTARVVVDGCDCIGFADHLDFESKSGCVVIRRKDGSGYLPSDDLREELNALGEG